LSAVAEFYSRHPITIYAASKLSGGYGIYAQAVAAHLSRHIPGNPKITCEPLEQDAGIALTRALATSLPRDGTVVGAMQGANTVETLLNPSLGFDTRRLSWLGSISRQNNTVITWHTSDIKTIDDARRREVIAGSENEFTNTGTMGNILNGVIGTRFRTVYGYDVERLRQALPSGEIEAVCGWGYGTMMAAHADWLAGNKVNILVHTGLEPDPMMPGVPAIIDFARTEEDRKVIRLMDTRTAMGRPYAAPPDVPEDRLAALRTGFAATLKDPAFLAEAKTRRLVIDPMDHAQMAATIKAAYALEPAVVRRTWNLLNGKPG
jgi:tripartite-type tricarboxylate transporter receptor subunit TctC